MFPLSGRCARLRDLAVEKKPLGRRIAALHAMHFEKGMLDYVRGGGTGGHSRIAAGVANVVCHAPAIIQDEEFLVGYNYADTPWPEFWHPEDTPEDRALLREEGFGPEAFEEYRRHHDEAVSYWQFDRHAFDFNARHDPTIANGRFPFLKDFTRAELELDDEWAAIGRCMSDNHTLVGYEQVLRLGFDGLRERVEACAARNGQSDMYDAMRVVCDAGCALGAGYAARAEAMAAALPEGDARRAELEQIARVCRRVPARPARTFHEALQSLLFAHILNTWEDGINANSLGRLDQMLYPYYRQDIEAGRIAPEQAFELLCCLWIKLYRDYDVQQSCVGGCGPDGADATNELSCMMLDVTEALGFVRCLSVRFSPRSDPRFIRRALEVVGHMQKGVPFFFNDDVLIPALCSKGVALEDARGYSQIGCVETAIPGLSNPHAVSGETNLLKAVEYVFGNGHSLLQPQRMPGLATGPLESLDTYAAFKAAVFRQMEHLLAVCCKKVALWAQASARCAPKPVKSLLTGDCVANGRDFNDAGARYDYYQIMLGGVPNLADSLLAVKTLVYDSARYTLGYFREQLSLDFPDEAFRQECLHKAPKFGNDVDEVDAVAAEIIDFCCDALDRLEQRFGLRFHAQPFTFLWMLDHGRACAASPDGRRRGESIAYSVSPMQGRDFSGLTALLDSLARMPARRCPGTVSAIVEVDPALFTDANIGLLADILLAAAEKGLSNVQFNVVNAQTLLDAQKHPERYNNLAVRVSGFSQKFNLLEKDLQDHIIQRTKHKCL